MTEAKQPNQEEILNALRQSLIKDTNEKYHAFIENIKKLPLPMQCMIDGIKQMDFGMLWIKEALNFSPIVLPDAKKEAEVVELNPELSVEAAN